MDVSFILWYQLIPLSRGIPWAICWLNSFVCYLLFPQVFCDQTELLKGSFEILHNLLCKNSGVGKVVRFLKAFVFISPPPAFLVLLRPSESAAAVLYGIKKWDVSTIQN
jgi:hypothetical protein